MARTRAQIDKLGSEIPALREAILQSVKRFDAMPCPVTQTTARLHDDTFQHVLNDYGYTEVMDTAWALASGTIPCWGARDKFPIGVQVVGLGEKNVLAVMRVLEKTTGGYAVAYQLLSRWRKPSGNEEAVVPRRERLIRIKES